MSVKLDAARLGGFVAEHELRAIAPQVALAHEMLHAKNGPGSDFLGWLELPSRIDRDELSRTLAAAQRIREDSQALVVIGIGGSYLGARAAIEFVHSPYYNSLPKTTPDIYFAGNTLSPDALQDVLRLCEDRELSVNVISKSGTTTESALAFRVFRDLMERKYGKDGAKKRIYCTTDRERGTLKALADREGYETFVIPDDIGGRFSVLTPVGLLPIAAAGCDIGALLRGAAAAQAALDEPDLAKNDAYRYAAIRNILLRKGRKSEVLVAYEPAFALFGEWYKQLFGESEGKDGKGLYPTSMIFSTDLHSLGQYVQEGADILFETVLRLRRPKQDFFLAAQAENFDGLNFLAGQNLSVVNDKAFLGTALAHVQGCVPNLALEIGGRDEYTLGYLIYFMEKACALSGYVLGVNPFDQPGVEAYKVNMFALLGKPGFEERRAALKAQLES